MNISEIFKFREPKKSNEFILDQSNKQKEQKKEKYIISKKIKENLLYIQNRFSYPKNNDIIIRHLTLKGERKAFLVMIDGMVDTPSVDLAIIEPLLHLPQITDEMIYTSKDSVVNKLIAHAQGKNSDDIENIIEEINFGGCAVFVDGIDTGFIMDVRNWGHRGIDKPQIEQSIYGPQEAFAEMLRNNSALVRKILKTEKLICEGIKVGEISKTRGVLMYISDIANDKLINEVRNRINSIKIDYIVSIEEVSLMIEDNSFMLTSQILSTERPDRVARFLSEGRVVLLLNGSPRALVFPTNAYEMTHTAGDAYMRVPFANMTRIIRLMAMFVSILLPGLYLAITLFHQQLIPIYLLYSISASRENVPFPSILEMVLMNFSFEMIREAGIRMPGPIGNTLGIVGGLILGQAAVSAKIVSPIMIIIIAITGIGSFATSDYSLSWTNRILRLVFIVLGATIGFYGIALGIFIYAMYIGGKRVFGIPFLSPLPKDGWGNVGGSILVKPLWKKENLPEYLKTKNKTQEPKISRLWKEKK